MRNNAECWSLRRFGQHSILALPVQHLWDFTKRLYRNIQINTVTVNVLSFWSSSLEGTNGTKWVILSWQELEPLTSGLTVLLCTTQHEKLLRVRVWVFARVHVSWFSVPGWKEFRLRPPFWQCVVSLAKFSLKSILMSAWGKRKLSSRVRTSEDLQR